LTQEEIAHSVGCHRNNLRNWRDQCIADGLPSLYINDYRKNKSALDDYSHIILPYFDENPIQSINQAVTVIEELTGIKRSPTQVREFLKRHDYKWRKMGQIPGKANVKEQQNWLDNTLSPYIEKAQMGLLHLFFCDAAHFTLGAFLCMVWCRVRIFLKTSSGRNRINVLGALNAVTKEVTTYMNTTYITAETIVDFMLQLKEQYVDLPIVLVMDNAKYQCCKMVTDKAKELEIEILFLPTYSPNLNITAYFVRSTSIERLWKFTRKKVFYGKYYDSPKKFHQAITSFFGELNQKYLYCVRSTRYQSELESLLTLNFQMWNKNDAQI